MDLVSDSVEQELPSGTKSSCISSALLVIDVQQGLFDKSTPVFKVDELLANINTLAARARYAGALVVYIQHANEKFLEYGSSAWRLHPDLKPEPEDAVIHKLHGNAFESTELDQLLKARQVGRLVITGLVTHGCVQATCLGALRLGYQVVLAMDGHSNYHRKAANLIGEWNQKLALERIEVIPTTAIQFE